MIDFISNLDNQLFYYLNGNLANPFFDILFPFITESKNWIPVWILLFAFIIYDFRKQSRVKTGIILVVLLAVCVGLSDFVSSKIIKEFVGRIRPCHTLEGVRLLVNCGAGKSFPSSHSVNNFAAALFLIPFYSKWRYYLIVVATLVAFSRVYVGVHYPFDILGGMAIGSAFGFSFSLIAKLVTDKFDNHKNFN
jgi:undecaprenyl-diphosphatase